MVSAIGKVNAEIARCQNIMNNPDIPESKKTEIQARIDELNAIKGDLDPAGEVVNNKYNPSSDEFSFSKESDNSPSYVPKNFTDGVLLMSNPLAYAILKKGEGQHNVSDNSGVPKNAAEGVLLMTNPLAYMMLKNVNPS